MVTTTTTYSFKKPTVGDDEDVWGGYLNDSMDLIDDVLDGTTPVTGIDINSGTIDNAVIGGTTPVAGTFTTLTANTSFGVTGNITVSGTVDGVDIAARDSVLTTTTATANAALPKAGGTMTGAITFASGQTFDGRDVSADGAKLDGIESGATADQTASEILTAIKTVDGSGSGLDADTLDGVQGSSFLRSDTADTANGNISFASGADLSGGLDSNLTGFIMPQNPEGKHIKSPYFFNDISYARLRGATISVDVDGTPMTDTNNIDNMLNANGDFWNMSTSGVTTVTITITDLPKDLTYGAYMGVVFGNTNWRANNITLEYSTNNGTSWTTARSTTTNSEEYFVDSFSSGATPTDGLRWTFQDFNSSSMRIVALFAYNYNSSGMEGLYVTRDGGTVYAGMTVQGTFFGETLQANGASLLQKYQSSWSYPTHDVVYNGYQSTLGDYTYLKSAGNSTSDHGQVIVSDNGVYFGKTNVETGAVVNSATAPFDNTTYGYINSTGLYVNGIVDVSSRVESDDYRSATNQQIQIQAGESFVYSTGQTGEYVYLNGDNGVQINCSPDNWASGWAGRDTFTFSSSGFQFPDGTTQTTAAPSATQDYGLITGSVTLTNDYGALS